MSVADIDHVRTAALRFAENWNQSLELERDRTNKQDPNAIKVFGCSSGPMRGYREVIGYVPKDVATCIVEGGYWGSLQTRLRKIYVEKDDYIDIEFQFCGPRKQKEAFQDLLEKIEDRKFDGKPAIPLQKEFYRTFDFKVPKGLTYLAAKQFIKEKSAEIGKEDDGALQAWKHYGGIVKALSNPEIQETYDIRAVSISRLRSAIIALVDEGHSLEDMDCDLEIVVEKLIDLRPNLEIEYPEDDD